MTAKKEQITSHQLGYLIVFLAIMFHLIALPASLTEVAGRDAWIVKTVFFLIDTVTAVLIFWAHKIYPGRTFFEIIEELTNKTVMRITAVVIAVAFLLRMYPNFAGVELYMINNLYNGLHWTVFTIPVAITLGIAAYFGIRSIARSTEIFGTVVIILVFLAIVFMFADSELYRILPIFEKGARPAAQGFVERFGSMGDFMPMLMFLGRFKKKEKTGKGLSVGIIFSGFVIVSINILFICFYDVLAKFQHHGQAISDMAHFSVGSDTIARLDIVMLVAWLIAGFFNLAVYAWCVSECMTVAVSGYKHARAFGAAVFILGIIIMSEINKYFDLSVVYYGPLKYWLNIPFVMILPVFVPVLAFAAKKKGVKNAEGE